MTYIFISNMPVTADLLTSYRLCDGQDGGVWFDTAETVIYYKSRNYTYWYLWLNKIQVIYEEHQYGHCGIAVGVPKWAVNLSLIQHIMGTRK